MKSVQNVNSVQFHLLAAIDSSKFACSEASDTGGPTSVEPSAFARVFSAAFVASEDIGYPQHHSTVQRRMY